jgi:hypothetical protein
MMDHASALKLAFDLMHFPSQVRPMRAAPLPDDLLVLLRIAAGEEEATGQAINVSGRPHPAVREAASFFIEQVLLYPEADSYRVLGARPEATSGELRRNMALLLRWLHPDLDRQGERSVFAGRVTRAWNDLKTPERRAAYDQSMRRSLAEKSLFSKKSPRGQNGGSSRRRRDGHFAMGPYRRPAHIHPDRYPALLRRVLLFLSLFGRTVH